MVQRLPPPPLRHALLLAVANARLDDASVLLAAAEEKKSPQRRVGAVYLAGYAVECALKARICYELGYHALPPDYWTHDLRWLAEKTRRGHRISQEPGIKDSFGRVVEMWEVGLRYQLPSLPQEEAGRFLVKAKEVTTWLFSG